MRAAHGTPPAVTVIAFADRFSPTDAHALARRVRTAVAAGARRFVVDLTTASGIAEGPLVLAMLNVRGDLHRVDGRLMVAAAGDLAARLAASLSLDDRLGAASSRDDAMIQVRRGDAHAPSLAMHCERCGTTWHRRGPDLILLLATTCRRCGGRLTAGEHTQTSPDRPAKRSRAGRDSGPRGSARARRRRSVTEGHADALGEQDFPARPSGSLAPSSLRAAMGQK